MTMAARRGPYVLQDQTLGSAGPGGGGPQGPQSVQIAPATAEAHYGSPGTGIGDGSGNASTTNIGAYAVDGQNSGTLTNRISMEIYNNGLNAIEISTNQNFIFGKNQARTIPAGASWSVLVGPANTAPNVKHYALCGTGNVCSIEVTELGQ